MNAHATSDPYVQAALDDECSKLARMTSGRNAGLNTFAYNMAQLGIPDETIEAEGIAASTSNGYLDKDGKAQVLRTIRSGAEAGRQEPRRRPAEKRHQGAAVAAARRVQAVQSSNENAPGVLPAWTEPDEKGRPPLTDIGSDTVKQLPKEIGRYTYRQGGQPDGQPVRIKAKVDSGYLNFYRVRRPGDGAIGWQSRKPAGYREVPYLGRTEQRDPIDPRFVDEILFWTEGEKDADTLAAYGELAITFGGASDVPPASAEWVRGRHVVIVVDNDDPGRKGAARKVAVATPVAASIRRIDFPELKVGGDVTDWLDAGGTIEGLLARAVVVGAEDAKSREPPERRGRSGAPVHGREERRGGQVNGTADSPNHSDGGGLDGRTEIRIANGEVPRAVGETEQAIIKAAMPIFTRSGSLVRPVIESVPAARGRQTQVARLKTMCAASLADHTAQVALYQRFDGRSKDWVTINPPAEVMNALLARDGKWRLHPIAGVITTPTLRGDGTILDRPGYDPETRLYLSIDPGFHMPAIPEHPGREEAEQALQLLEDLLGAFPFVGEVDRAVGLSALMTPVVRGALPTAPLHAIRASTPGTGKSYLVDLASVIATGRRCPVIAAGRTEEETEKRLGALLREGVPIISIDNVNGELGGDALCQMTNMPVVRVRVLGKSEAPETECRATVFATGNGLILVGDMTRRTLLCTLDTQAERPELRDFDFDPIERVQADRGQYVAAVLTIIRAYRAAGSPKVCGPVGSYEDWTEAVRAPLIWLGQPDPCASMEKAREEDPELSAIRELFAHWQEHLSLSGSYTANAIIKAACEKGPGANYDYGMQEFRAPEFRDLLLRQAGDGGAVSSKRLGKWLSKISGRVLGVLRVEMKSDPKHGNRFTLRQIEPPSEEEVDTSSAPRPQLGL